MDSELLAQRIQDIFYRLSCEDPKFPKVNFFVRLMDDTKKHLLKRGSDSLDLSEAAIYRVMKEAAQELAHNYAQDTQWKEIMGSCFSEDIYEYLKPIIEHK